MHVYVPKGLCHCGTKPFLDEKFIYQDHGLHLTQSSGDVARFRFRIGLVYPIGFNSKSLFSTLSLQEVGHSHRLSIT